MTTPFNIPVACPDLSGNEEKYVTEAVRSSWISSQGPFLERFEAEFAQACESKHAIAVANGTVALHLALLALDVRPGDEVIVPALTYVATANAVAYMGAEPVFVDIDPATWCLDPRLIEPMLSPRTKGIIAVHLYGHPADMDAINEIATIHGLWVIEDAAEAHFARYKGRSVGSMARIGTFSFYGNKIVTSGEGGAITCSDAALATRMRILRGQGQDPRRRYWFPIIGHNFRLTNVAAALLCAQLEHADSMMASRRRRAAQYAARLHDFVDMQPVAEWASAVPWTFCIASDRVAAIKKALTTNGVETRPFFVPLPAMPPYRLCRTSTCPVAGPLERRGLCLPMFSGLTEAQVDSVCDVVIQAAP